MARKPSWGHVSRTCIHCGEVGPRVLVGGGYAHRRCIDRAEASKTNRRHEPPPSRPLDLNAVPGTPQPIGEAAFDAEIIVGCDGTGGGRQLLYVDIAFGETEWRRMDDGKSAGDAFTHFLPYVRPPT